MAHKFSFPSRNEARAIIIALAKQYAKINGSGSIPKKELTTYAALLYKANGIDYSSFVFTNALIDIFSDMNVDSENYVDNSIMVMSNKSLSDLEQYFVRILGDSFENIIKIGVKESSEFNVQLVTQGSDSLDMSWFNNSNKFIHPLLAGYQSFKKRKGMLFQKDDINQIPIDYSVVLCCNHYRQKGFLNESICSQIVNILTDAANECINTITINPDDIEYFVKHDLESAARISQAFDFIKQF
jgi:hypothetical protein